MGLFDKKNCDICGEKIGALGNRKVEDGNICKNCAKKLSPWFSERKKSTVDQIKEQLAWREANQERVEAFQVTRTLGVHERVLLDENSGRFLVTSSKKWKEENPDVLDLADVTGCDTDVEEHREEIMMKNREGKMVSCIPPRYRYTYDFYAVIHVNCPYFDEMRVQLNSSAVDGESRREYNQYQDLCEEIKAVFAQARDGIAAANAPKAAVTCPWCGATTVPDERGCCEYCGAAVNG